MHDTYWYMRFAYNCSICHFLLLLPPIISLLVFVLSCSRSCPSLLSSSDSPLFFFTSLQTACSLPIFLPTLTSCLPFLSLLFVVQKHVPLITQNVITIQPPPTIIVYERKYGMGDHFLLLSVLLSFLFFFCGCWLALFCTIPAIFFAISVSYVIVLTVQLVPKAVFNYSMCFACTVNVGT